MANIIDLIERGASYRLGAAMADQADDLRAALGRYDSLQGLQDKVVAEKAIINREQGVEWRESWGERPEADDISYDEIDEAQADLNESYAEILDTIVAILRTEG